MINFYEIQFAENCIVKYPVPDYENTENMMLECGVL